jgi:hypothetical protein
VPNETDRSSALSKLNPAAMRSVTASPCASSATSHPRARGHAPGSSRSGASLISTPCVRAFYAAVFGLALDDAGIPRRRGAGWPPPRVTRYARTQGRRRATTRTLARRWPASSRPTSSCRSRSPVQRSGSTPKRSQTPCGGACRCGARALGLELGLAKALPRGPSGTAVGLRPAR